MPLRPSIRGAFVFMRGGGQLNSSFRCRFSERLEQFGSGEVSSRDEVQERTEAPGGRLAYEVKAWNGGLQRAGENGTACAGPQRLSDGGVEEVVAGSVCAVAG